MSDLASSKIPVLVVGGGPSGLVAALTLLKNDIPVRIIDKQPSYHLGQRGAGIMPRTLELFHYLGVLPDVLSIARKLVPMCMYKLPGGTEPARVSEISPYEDPTPSVPFRNPLLLGQATYEDFLRQHIAKYSVNVELNTELVGFEQDASGVTAHIVKHDGEKNIPETIRTEFLVGADGARGAVRKLLGLSFLGKTFDGDSIVIGDIYVKGLDENHWHMWGDFRAGTVSLRPTEFPGRFSLMTGGNNIDHTPLLTDRDALINFMKKISFREDLEYGEITWLAEFRPNIRMVDKFGEGRVFVAGDAAHVHPPTGGQGMNSSVQDSFNLAWKIANVIKGHSPPTILDSYTTERLPVIRDMLTRTSGLLDKTTKHKGDGKDASAFNRPKVLHQIGVNYRWSDIVVDEQPSLGTKDELEEGAYGMEDPLVLRAGDRAPDAPDLIVVGKEREKTSLFSIFTPSKHTALLFVADAKEAEGVLGALKAFPEGTVQAVVIFPQGSPNTSPVPGATLTVTDAEAHVQTGYPPVREDFKLVVVRPDGVVGAIVRGEEGLKRYVHGVFTI